MKSANDNEDREIWKPVPSYPGVLASSWGRVMIEPHEVTTVTERNGTRTTKHGGYPRVGSWQKGSGQGRYIFARRGYRTRKVHQMVCEAFHGPPPPGMNYCLHIDENSRNNRPENLKWGTQKENLNAPGFLKYCQGRTGERSPTVKARKRRVA